MAFTDHKIAAFTHKISDLADQPNLPPDELKARFDACPEQLRQAVNAICDDAGRLDERVTGIVAGTFGDTITEDMLSDELRETIEGAAAGGAVAEQIEAETTAREAADAALDARVDWLETRATTFSRVHTQLYTGTGASSREIYLGFHAKVIIIMQNSNRTNRSDLVTGGMAVRDYPLRDGFFGTVGAEIKTDSMVVYENQAQNVALNTNGAVYWFFALY